MTMENSIRKLVMNKPNFGSKYTICRKRSLPTERDNFNFENSCNFQVLEVTVVKTGGWS